MGFTIVTLHYIMFGYSYGYGWVKETHISYGLVCFKDILNL